MKIDISTVIGAGYKAFWNCHKRYRVLKGGKASKKSSTTALWYIYNMMKYPDSNLLCIRNVYDTHRDSTFAQLKWAIRMLHVEDYWQTVLSPMEIRYKPTGQKILFRGFDNVDKIASTTVDKGKLCWVWIEEAFELASEADFDKLDLSAPRGEVEPPLFKQTTLTFNPWSEKHWLKKRFFDNPSSNVGTFTTNYLCNEFLDEADRLIYDIMKEDNPRKYAVAGLGEWGISDGLVYENWTVQSFCIDSLLQDEDGWKYRCLYGLDYGYSNDPTAFIAIAVNPIDKLLYVFDENYQTRMLNSDIADMIRRKGYAKERIRADSAEPKSNEELRRMGISRVMPAEKGKDSIVNGIARIQEYKIIVHPSCQNTQAELSSYIWGKAADGSGINKPVDRDNHLMDAMRYAMTDIVHFRPKKEENLKGWKKYNGAYIYSGNLQNSDFVGGWDG